MFLFVSFLHVLGVSALQQKGAFHIPYHYIRKAHIFIIVTLCIFLLYFETGVFSVSQTRLKSHYMVQVVLEFNSNLLACIPVYTGIIDIHTMLDWKTSMH